LINHIQLGLIVTSFCFVGIILSGLSQNFDLMLSFIISMIISGFAILAYTLSKNNKIALQTFTEGITE